MQAEVPNHVPQWGQALLEPATLKAELGPLLANLMPAVLATASHERRSAAQRQVEAQIHLQQRGQAPSELVRPKAE